MSSFELEQTRDFLQRSLDDLELERAAGDIEDADYEALKAKYSARAAEVQAELAAATVDGQDEVGQLEPARPSRRRSRRAAAIIALVALIGTGAGFALASSSGERVATAPATGSIDASTTDLLAQARELLGKNKPVDAIKTYDRVLKTDPKNPEALAYRGWIVRLAGLPDDGLAYIERAIAADPAYPDAHFFKGMILWQDKHQPVAAVPEFQLFLASNPPQDLATVVQGALQQAQADATGQAAPTTSTTVGSPAP